MSYTDLTTRTVTDRAGFNNAIDDDIEKIIIQGKIAQKCIGTLKLGRFADKAGIPGAIIALLINPLVSVGFLAAKAYAMKIKKYTYEITGTEEVIFTMQDRYIDELRSKKKEKK